jgi:hypothetical protein
MPTYAAYGNNFGITLDTEPDEVAAKLASAPGPIGKAAALG